ncbi:hypothetical protein A7982_12869 [Minicystis rosea]|nr:hypothetical protein A7982_12869 [Minicystis rosea]
MSDAEKPGPPPAPPAVLATSALLAVIAPALLARQAAWAAAWMLVAALVPWWPPRRVAAIVMAYAGAGLFLWSLVRVPLGGRAVVYALGAAALGLRVWALRTDAARRWRS